MTVDRLITAHGRPHDRPDLPAARAGAPGPARRCSRSRGLSQPGVVKDIALQRAAGRGGGHLRPHGLGPLGDGAHPVRPRPLRAAGTIAVDGAPLDEPDPAGGHGPRHRLPDRGPPRRGPDDGRPRSPTTSPCRRCRRFAAGWGRAARADAARRRGRARPAATCRSTPATSCRRWSRTCRAATSRRWSSASGCCAARACSSSTSRRAASTSAPSTRSTRSSTAWPPTAPAS